MNNRLIKLLLFFGVLGLTAIVAKEIVIYQKIKPLCPNCNVLLISIDTLAAKHLQCYGYERETAPNLCKFAKENILFSNSYSQSHWTRPSQTSVLTGLHMSTHKVSVAHAVKLEKKYKTIAETFKDNNYQTIYSGTILDDGSWPQSVIRGFDYLFEQDYKTGNLLDHWYKALERLEQNKKNKIPTFMYLHTYYVHAPYVTGEENLKFITSEMRNNHPEIILKKEDYHTLTAEMRDFVVESLRDRVKNSKTEESLKLNTEMLKKMESAKSLEESKKIFASLPEYEIDGYAYDWYFTLLSRMEKNDYVGALYDERIYQLDKEMENFLNKIREKFDKDTIVVFYSDHGETVGERGSYGHCDKNDDCLYNETIRVPLIFKVPGIKEKKIEEITQGIDIYPTILKLVGIAVPEYVEGKNLAGVIGGEKSWMENRYIVSEQDDLQKAVVDKKWKMYFKDYKNMSSDNMELYDIENDLYEQNNLLKSNPKEAKIKIKQLNEFVKTISDKTPKKYNFPDWIDEVKREKLIKEGYF